MKQDRHIIHTMPAPKSLLKKAEKAKAIRMYADLIGGDMPPHEKSVSFNFAKAIMEYEIAKFHYEAINKPYYKKLKYCHEIELDDKNITFVRYGKIVPGVLERMKINYNINL